MDMDEILCWRRVRLLAAVNEFYEGNKAQLGRELGFKDGSYVGQMIKGIRPIEEDRVLQIEALKPRLKGWFALPESPDDTLKRDGGLHEPNVLDNVVTPSLPQAVTWEAVVSGFDKLPKQFWVSVTSQSPVNDLGSGDSIEFEKGSHAVPGDIVIVKTPAGSYLMRRYVEIEPGVFRTEGGAGHAPLHSAQDGIVVVAYAVRLLKSIRRK